MNDESEDQEVDDESEDQEEGEPFWKTYNREFKAARTDDERREVLERYMGPRAASHILAGGTDIRDEDDDDDEGDDDEGDDDESDGNPRQDGH